MKGLVFASLIAMFVALVVLSLWCVLRFRKFSVPRRFMGALLPASQALIVAMYLISPGAGDLPAPFAAFALATGAVCVGVDGAMLRHVAAAEDLALAAERARVAEDQVAARKRRVAQLRAQAAEAARTYQLAASRLIDASALLRGASEREALDALRSLAFDGARAEGREGARGPSRAWGGSVFCAHAAVDALLAMKAAACEQAGIRADFRAMLPERIGLPDIDACAAFSNIIDNAIAGARDAAPEHRFVVVRARTDESHLVIAAENGFAPGGERDRGSEGTCGEGPARGQVRACGTERVRDAVREEGGEGASARDATRGAGGEGASARIGEHAGVERAIASHGWGLEILEALSRKYNGTFGSGPKAGEGPESNVWATTLVLRLSSGR